MKIYQNTSEPKRSPSDRIAEFEFFLDGDNIRQDVARYVSSSLIKDIIAINSEEGKRYLFTVGTEDGLPGALQVYSYDKDSDENAGRIKSLFVDFRIIGFLPTGFFLQGDTNEVVTSGDRINLRMVDETLEGIDCKKISCTHKKSGSNITYWIVPSQGYNIIRFDCNDNEGCVDSTVLKIAEDTKSGVWLPISSEFTRLYQGKLEISEKIRVEVVSLNQKLDSAYFTPTTMEVPVGTHVFTPESTEQNFFWDGEKIVGERGGVFADEKYFSSHYSKFRLFLIATGLAMISVACFFKYLTYREKKQANKNNTSETPS